MDYFRAHSVAVDEYANGYQIIDTVVAEMMAASKITNVDKIMEDLSSMALQNILIRNQDYEVKDRILKIKIAAVYSKYERWAKRNATAEKLDKHSFLQQIQGKTYFVAKKTIRIGGAECNGIQVDLGEMPKDLNVDGFSGDNNQNGSSEEAEDDGVSWREKEMKDIHEMEFRNQTIDGYKCYNDKNERTLTYLLQQILYDDQITELEIIMAELWERNWSAGGKYDKRIVKMLLNRRKDLFGHIGDGYYSLCNGRRYFQS
jgi:hypothetical protein